MSAYQVPNVAAGGGILPTDSEATASSLMGRDSDGHSKINILRALTGLRNAGHLYLDYQAESTSMTIDEATENGTVYGVSASGGARTVTLPAAATVGDKVICVKKTDSSVNAVTVDGSGSETIDGLTTFVLYTQHDCIWIVCDGTGWHVVAEYRRAPTIAKSALFTAESQRVDITYLVTNASAFSATLPTAASMNGVKLTFVKVDAAAFALTLDGDASETINGSATNAEIDAQWDSLTIQSNGVAWFIIARKIT